MWLYPYDRHLCFPKTAYHQLLSKDGFRVLCRMHGDTDEESAYQCHQWNSLVEFENQRMPSYCWHPNTSALSHHQYRDNHPRPCAYKYVQTE